MTAPRLFVAVRSKKVLAMRTPSSDAQVCSVQIYSFLQCVGCDRNFLWYSVGILLVSLVRVGIRWPCWYSPKLINGLECGL